MDGESKRILELPLTVVEAFFPSNGAMLVLSVGLSLFADPLRLAAYLGSELLLLLLIKKEVTLTDEVPPTVLELIAGEINDNSKNYRFNISKHSKIDSNTSKQTILEEQLAKNPSRISSCSLCTSKKVLVDMSK